MTTTVQEKTIQVYQVFIKASPEQIWDAITKPEFTERYFYGSRIETSRERRVSTAPDGSSRGDDATIEFDPPRKLVQEWRSRWDPEAAPEPASRVTWEIEPGEDGVSMLTLVHDQLEASPKTAEGVAGGWMRVLSGLKTLLETGQPL
jgi:uncharacterized protein YndB with AHSA1/START domain